jgi:hypothetical protein
MLYLKENPQGIDIPIQNLQKYIYRKLLKIWNITDSKYLCCGRSYRNQTDKSYIPEIYMGNGEYKDAFFDDTVSAVSFFSMNEKTDIKMLEMTNTVSLIFCVNIKELKSGIQHMADEEVRLDVMENVNVFGFSLVSIDTGIDNVFREYDKTRIKFRDIYPLHCFRLNLKIQYSKC